MEGYLFKTSKDCCVANFEEGLECHLVDVCEDYSANMKDIIALSRMQQPKFAASVPIVTATMTSLETTVSTEDEAATTTHAATTVVTTPVIAGGPCSLENHCRSPSGHCGPPMLGILVALFDVGDVKVKKNYGYF
jgi:hypothetical protein